jgi:hypothetical protein
METTKNKFGLLHSIDDKPSFIDDEGNKYWHKDGKLHRDNDMPSIIMNNGNKFWYINGVPSRSDISLPYIEMSNGYKEYRLENGGHKTISHLKEEWFDKNSDYHREDGPAYIRYNENGNIKYEAYYLNGKGYRKNGPATIRYYENGNIQCEYYYLNENCYSKKDYLEKIKELNSCNKDDISSIYENY